MDTAIPQDLALLPLARTKLKFTRFLLGDLVSAFAKATLFLIWSIMFFNFMSRVCGCLWDCVEKANFPGVQSHRHFLLALRRRPWELVGVGLLERAWEFLDPLLRVLKTEFITSFFFVGMLGRLPRMATVLASFPTKSFEDHERQNMAVSV